MDNKKIGLFLASLRKEKKLTQANLAELLNVTPQAISRWETGESIPDIKSLSLLSTFYEVSIDEIIKGEKENKEKVVVQNYNSYYDLNKLKKNNLIVIGISIISLILFFGITLAFYNETIGFTVQLILLVTSSLVFIFGFNDYESRNKDNELKSFIEYMKYKRKMIMIISSIYIFSITLASPYIVLDSRHYLNSIISSSTYYKSILIFLFFAVIINIITLKFIDDYFVNKVGNTEFKNITSGLTNKQKKYLKLLIRFLYLPVVVYIVLWPVVTSNELVLRMTVVYLSIILIVHDIIKIILNRQYIFSIRIILSSILIYSILGISFILSKGNTINYYHIESVVGFVAGLTIIILIYNIVKLLKTRNNLIKEEFRSKLINLSIITYFLVSLGLIYSTIETSYRLGNKTKRVIDYDLHIGNFYLVMIVIILYIIIDFIFRYLNYKNSKTALN